MNAAFTVYAASSRHCIPPSGGRLEGLLKGAERAWLVCLVWPSAAASISCIGGMTLARRSSVPFATLTFTRLHTVRSVTCSGAGQQPLKAPLTSSFAIRVASMSLLWRREPADRLWPCCTDWQHDRVTV